ncbi:FAD-binding protein [Eggerthella sinensis]|uniref:FAD-binding protein n=1 Tax=Eggerthella sinensis TaxID=242230 RepID=UPI002FD84177
MATESKSLSRRNFLKGAAITGAAVAGSAALAGCASGSTAASADWQPKSWDYETDVVVVGYGGAGMWSSLVAADEGGSEVVILEKAPVEGGGNSRINNGEWTVIKDEKVFRDYCIAFGHGLMEEDMIDAYIAEASQHTDYADKYGMTYEVAEQALAGTIPEYWFLDDGKYAGCIGVSSVDGFGMTTFHELEAKRAELGLPIELKFKCTEEHLIQNPDTKEICGVRFLEDGAEKTIKARKGVVLCTGGFEFNEDLKNEYLKIYRSSSRAGSTTRATASAWLKKWARSCGTWAWSSLRPPCGRAIPTATSPFSQARNPTRSSR